MPDRQRWNALWSALGSVGQATDALFDRLQACYSEPHRSYHNLAHLADCLTQFDAARSLTAHPAEVEAALWLHDVIYDPQRQDNEERSADWAGKAFAEMGVPVTMIDPVAELILATKHIAPPSSPDAMLVMDIDLSILGRLPATFDRYEQAIREEYAWVPADQFRTGRAKILQGFLARKRIYQTAHFYHHFEQQARQNLRRSLQTL